MTETQPTFSLVIPLYNEEKNVTKVIVPIISELKKERIDYELILVNNGSQDETGKLIKELNKKNSRIKLVKIEVNQGYGWGIISGLKKTRGKYIGFMCGDEQVHPGDVIKTYHKLVSDNLDLCKVSRVIRQDGFKRRLISIFYNFIFSLIFPVKSRDINGTPKIMKREVYEKINLKSKDWFIDAEAMIKCEKKGYKIGEVPIIFYQRKEGVSNVKLSTIFEFLKNILRYRIKGLD